MNATAEDSPRRKPRKLRKGPGRASVDESADISTTMASSVASSSDGQKPPAGGGGMFHSRDAFDRTDSELPTLPVGENSYLNSMDAAGAPSIVEPRSHGDEDEEEGVGMTMDEGDMRRHFMDVESSFLPEGGVGGAGGVREEGRLGADDTYLELGKPGRTPPDQMFASLSEGRRGMFAPPEMWQDTGEGQQSGSGNDGEDERESPSEEDVGRITSSPAAAAWQRGHGRNGSSTTALYRINGNSRPSTPGQRPESKGSTIKPEYSPQSSAGPVDENGIDTTPKSRLRPSVLSNRQVSQYSSISTATMSTDRSEGDVTAELPGGSPRSQLMNRLPSFASAIDSDAPPTLSRGVSGISVLAGMRRGRPYGNDEVPPETPNHHNGNTDAPTDTVLAQHVQNIQVPETVARDFRAKNRGLSPEKQRPLSSSAAGGAPMQGAPRRTLTLKEQNGKIDKLTKENFDLKLKIHFLDQALQSRSDDGVKELIDKNVQFQTDLANERKETQSLRRKMRELERKVKEQDDSLAQAKAQHEQAQKRSREDDDDDDPTLQAEMHEEILFLRQQLDHSENKVTTLTEDVMTKELEKRKMAEHMRSMAGSRGEDTAGMKETMDMWQDLLNAETGRREQAEDDIRRLREELTSLQVERASPAPNAVTKRRGGYEESLADDEYTNGVHGSAGSLAVVEQLKHENAELRKDLGAQTSMLTSRNRERERLQQEIEDLKLLHRKGGDARSVAGESIFERSISRAHNRAPSRASEAPTQVTEAEREDWDKKEGQLRDQNAELRLKFQELERTHSTHLQYQSALESDFEQIENELNEATEDLRALQTERDEALQAFEEKEKDLENLEQEALAEIEKLEKEMEGLQSQLQDALKRQQKTLNKLEHTMDGYKGLQGELREITQSVMSLEDEKQANMRTIQTLEEQIAETEDELQRWEEKCTETEQKNHKLEVTQESLHSEITFLREEQEGDKIKIGELEDGLNAAQQQIQDEQEKLRELEEAIVEERQQRDTLENKSKADVQRVLDDLNSEGQRTKDEVRKLRRALSAKEVESNGWKQKLDELESNLRDVLGDPEGTRQSLLSDIEKVQRELEVTTNSLERAKMDLADKDRVLRHRDGLLESTSLESRRLSDLLDKERASRRRDLEQFEKSSRGQATSMRTIAQQESRVMELEAAFTQDKRRMAQLEQQYRDQLSERNSLLLALWNRLSTLCGADWAQAYSLVDGELPSVDVISRKLPGFNKNLIAAVKTVESLIGTFKTRIRGIEKDLWKDYQTLEHNLDMRIRRMDGLEKAVMEAQAAIAEERQNSTRLAASGKGGGRGTEEIAKLKSEAKLLKAELKFHRQHPSAMASQMINNQQAVQQNEQLGRRGSASAGSGMNGKTGNSPARNIVANLLRHHSTSAVETLQHAQQRPPPPGMERQQSQPIVLSPPPVAPAQPSEQRWVHRLKELERRLKAEREARLLDRRGARQRLEEGRLENEELRLMLEHERVRRGSEAETVGEGETPFTPGSRRLSPPPPMPAMLDDPTAPAIYRVSGDAPYPVPFGPLPEDITIKQVTLRDRVTTATLVPFSSPTQVPPKLAAYLCALLNREIEKGDTYPMMDSLALSSFAPYWFANFAAVMVQGDISSIQEINAMELRGADWSRECFGSFYVKPNYPGRSSHVCNGGFLVTDAARNRGVGRLMGECYLDWAPKLGYTYSVFNLVYETNVASLRIWDALGFKRIGRVKGCGNLQSYPDELIDAIIFGRELGGEGDEYITEERFDKIRYYLRNGTYPQGSDRAEKSRLRSAATHYRILSSTTGNEDDDKLMLKGKEVISDPHRQYEIARQIHAQTHGGINKTTASIAEKYHWVRIKETVSAAIRNCSECKEPAAGGGKTPAARDRRGGKNGEGRGGADASANKTPSASQLDVDMSQQSQQQQVLAGADMPSPHGQQHQHVAPVAHMHPSLDAHFAEMPVDPQILQAWQTNGMPIDAAGDMDAGEARLRQQLEASMMQVQPQQQQQHIPLPSSETGENGR